MPLAANPTTESGTGVNPVRTKEPHHTARKQKPTANQPAAAKKRQLPTVMKNRG